MKLSSTRSIQVVFIAMFAVAALQLGWWLYDQSRLSGDAARRSLAMASGEVVMARRLLLLGEPRDKVLVDYPQLTLDADGQLIIAPQFLAEVEARRASWMNRYRWECAFFLFVLGLGIVVIQRSWSHQRNLSRRQDNFLAAVTHEFKSPIASVRLAAETLEYRDPPIDDRRRLIGRLLLDLSRLEGMVTKLLETARLDEGALDVQASYVGLADSVTEVVQEIVQRTPSAKKTPRVELDIAPDLELFADPVTLESVLRNLVENAVKYAPLDRPANLSITATTEGRDLLLRVADDGVGFEPAEANRLFEKFYRPGEELRRTRPGTGLGLYLVRRIVELHGGTVRASSEGPGSGATFTVRWPRWRTTEAATAAPVRG